MDNGISATEEMQELKSRGHPVILTDHHLPVTEGDKIKIPEADIIVNPHVNKGSFDGYCGAGIALKIIRRLLPEDDVVMPLLTAYAAIGTIADMMDLVEENRRIVMEGLEVLNGKKGILTKGMKALVEILGKEELTADDIAFGIGPMLNAPGRLEDNGAVKSLELIIKNNDTQESIEKALLIRETNEERKAFVDEAVKKMEDMEGDIRCPSFLFLPDMGEGIIGLIAAKLVEKYKMPAFVFTKAEDGTIKGSARSTDTIHMKNLLDKHKELFISYGGHKGAAGIKMKEENLNELERVLQEELKDFVADDTEYYDIDINPKDAMEIYKKLKAFAPFGKGNELPVFAIKSIIPDNYMLMGEKKQHMKIRTDGCDILCFNKSEDILECQKQPMPMNFFGKLSVNIFRGMLSMQMIVKDHETEKV